MPTNQIPKTTFGEHLQDLRKANNLTQEELAKKLKCHRNSIIAWESNRYLPVAPMKHKIAKYFKLGSDEVVVEGQTYTTSSYFKRLYDISSMKVEGLTDDEIADFFP